MIRFLLPINLTRAVDGTGRPPVCGSSNHFALRKDGTVAVTPGEIRAAGAAAWIAVQIPGAEGSADYGMPGLFIPVCPPCADRFIKEGF